MGMASKLIIPGLFEPPVRTLRATIPENGSQFWGQTPLKESVEHIDIAFPVYYGNRDILFYLAQQVKLASTRYLLWYFIHCVKIQIYGNN